MLIALEVYKRVVCSPARDDRLIALALKEEAAAWSCNQQVTRRFESRDPVVALYEESGRHLLGSFVGLAAGRFCDGSFLFRFFLPVVLHSILFGQGGEIGGQIPIVEMLVLIGRAGQFALRPERLNLSI